MLAYRAVAKAKPASNVIAAAKEKAYAAFNNIQEQFCHETGYLYNGVKARRGTPFTSFERATNIVMSSRMTTIQHLFDDAQLNNLVKFSKYSKVLGNGLAVIDFASGVGEIHNEYKAGGDWERQMFVISASFAAGATTGIVGAKVGAALFAMATPAGWVAVIVAGSAAASIYVNSKAQSNAGSLYDYIMEKIGLLWD